MLLSRSLRRKLLATVLGSGIFLLLYEATVIDSRTITSSRVTVGTSGSKVDFTATAYCKGQTTASGHPVKSGVAAADPSVLPLGSIVRVDGAAQGHQGIYTVLDTGPKIQGRLLDLYMWSCHEALAFGRRPITVTVLRRGWNPKDTAQGLAKPGNTP